ncbi:MAG: HEPN domain-containing protein [Planctomycetes bacterium]|nr:HEPN domain-containing protein [Planctomycetota bacterium]
MREKALQNLRLARALFELGLYDGATTHLYYAAFQALIFAFDRKGLRPKDFHPGAKRWEHWMVVRHAPRARGLAEDSLLLKKLRRLRNRADYEEGGIESRALRDLLARADPLIREATT